MENDVRFIKILNRIAAIDNDDVKKALLQKQKDFTEMFVNAVVKRTSEIVGDGIVARIDAKKKASDETDDVLRLFQELVDAVIRAEKAKSESDAAKEEEERQEAFWKRARYLLYQIQEETESALFSIFNGADATEDDVKKLEQTEVFLDEFANRLSEQKQR